MNSLEASVLLMAGLAILLVAGYNVWLMRARGAGRGTTRRADANSDRADGQRGEPRLGPDMREGEQDSAGDFGIGEAGSGDHLADAPRGGAPMLDPLVDSIVEWALPAPVAGERLIHWLHGLRRAGGKPVVVEAAENAAPAEASVEDRSRGTDAERAPDWGLPSAGRQYRCVRIGVLLANRHGPLNAMEFTEFVGAVQALAEQLAVLPDTPDMSAVLARARALDETCERLDAQVGIGIEAPDVLGVGDLARLARECGCDERGNNRHVRLTDQGEVLFSLALADAPNRLGLLLDVPRAPVAKEPWREMLESAKLCAQRLGGALTDDTGRALSPQQIERIGQLIAQRQRELEDAGFVPGSALALRVFN